jgi:hypothetical protein
MSCLHKTERRLNRKKRGSTHVGVPRCIPFWIPQRRLGPGPSGWLCRPSKSNTLAPCDRWLDVCIRVSTCHRTLSFYKPSHRRGHEQLNRQRLTRHDHMSNGSGCNTRLASYLQVHPLPRGRITIGISQYCGYWPQISLVTHRTAVQNEEPRSEGSYR